MSRIIKVKMMIKIYFTNKKILRGGKNFLFFTFNRTFSEKLFCISVSEVQKLSKLKLERMGASN